MVVLVQEVAVFVAALEAFEEVCAVFGGPVRGADLPVADANIVNGLH